MEEDIRVLQKADPAFQETLVCEVVPDPMDGEQTWPTDEEIKEAGRISIKCTLKRNAKVPSTEYKLTDI
jgi:pre-rRNA-processing protein TSR1